MWQHPGTTLEDKLNPIWSSMAQLLRNRDYWGSEIWGPDDTAFQKAVDAGKFAIKQLQPFSFSGGNQFAQNKPPGDNVGPLRQLIGSKAVHTILGGVEIPASVPIVGGAHLLGAPTYGLTPAAKFLSTSPAELRAQEIENRLHGGETRTQEEYEKGQARSALRTLIAQSDGDMKIIGPAIRDAIKAGTIQPKDVKKLQEDARLSPLERMARNISMEYQRKGDAPQGYRMLLSVWEESTPAEQQKLQRYIGQLWVKAKQSGANVGEMPVAKGKGDAHPGDVSMQ